MTAFRGSGRRAEAAALGLSLLLAVAASGQLAAQPSPADPRAVLVGAAAGLVALIVAARGCFLRWKLDREREAAWGWLAAGLTIAVSFGVVIMTVQVVWPLPGSTLEGDQRMPLAVSGIAALCVLGWGLLRLPWRPATGLGRVLTWLDGALIFIAVFLVARELFAAPGIPMSDVFLLLLRPPAAAAALVVISFLVVSRARQPGGAPIRQLLVVSTGTAILGAVIALIYAPSEAAAESWYWLAPPGVVIGCSLIAVAAGGFLDSEGALDDRLRERTSVLAPVLPLAGAFAVVAWRVATTEPLTPVGTFLTLLLVVTAVLTTGVARLHALSVARTLELRVAERTLALGSRERWFRGLVQHSTDVITVVDRDGTIRYQTPSVERVLGYASGQLTGEPITSLVRRDDVDRVRAALARASIEGDTPHTLQFPLLRADGEWIDVETTVTSLLEEADVGGLVLNSRDVTERLRLEQELTHQAYSDSLTGLANRTMFRRSVVEAVRRSTDPRDVAVVYLDLDGFKSVNDARGHETGDVLLTHVAVRLRNCVRPGDLIARLGGDEFGILVTGERAEDSAEWIAQRVTATLVEDFTIDGRLLHVGASVGIALNDLGDETADQMLRNADLAMYRAKADDRRAHVRYEADMHRVLVQRVRDENDLRQALAGDEFVLHYQPIVDLTSRRAVGVEALVRWNHPERGLLPPAAFVELAEETGLIEPLGAWVLAEASRQAGRWQGHAGTRPFRMAVNVSASQLTPEFVEHVAGAIEENSLPPAVLTLEITESILVDHEPGTMSLMEKLRALGTQIAVDDFGTGYSSLSYLAQFPVDILKIDRAFVQHVGSATEQAELARTIVQLGRSLNMTTVAEGIETGAQLEGLQELGCLLGQGYHFARPAPSHEVEEYFSQGWPADGGEPVTVPALA